jgi:transcription elongation factor SPT6
MPFKNLNLGEDMIEDEYPVVLAITWGEGDRNAIGYATILNENGELIDFLKLRSLSDRDNQRDLDTLIASIAQHTPEVIVIGGFKPNTKSALFKIIQERVEGAGRAAGKWDNEIPILFVEDDFARLFMNSKRGLIDFPEKDYPMLIRYCVALGRKTQSPTLAYASLFNAEDDFKAIRLHPLQDLLSEDALKAAVERSFINGYIFLIFIVVNQCGVDVNAAANFPHLAGSLQFVSGLGPRKSQAIISKIIRSGGKLETRHDLIRKGICGSKIFSNVLLKYLVNCASFIRIRMLHFTAGYRDTQLDVLDDTRIHPEDYDLARKMAADALDIDEIDEENPSQNVQDLMEGDVDRLNLLMLDDYAIELERQIHAPKRICLNEIKEELMAPYKDKRQRFEQASTEEIFAMLTGESPDTFKEGIVTSACIIKAHPKFLACKLPSGMDGSINLYELDISMDDQQYVSRLFPPHCVLQCVVLSVDKEKIQCELSAKKSNLDQQSQQYHKDQFFSNDLENNDLNAVTSKIRTESKENRQKRVIPHPYFKQMSYNEAEDYLSSRLVGDLVVRPSTKGHNHISITWKVLDDIYQHLGFFSFNLRRS